MPRRPIRRCLTRRSVTHLRMHDKVLLDFPVATVCSLLSLLNMHERPHTPNACVHPQHAFICVRGYVSEGITSAVVRWWGFGLDYFFTAVKTSEGWAELPIFQVLWQNVCHMNCVLKQNTNVFAETRRCGTFSPLRTDVCETSNAENKAGVLCH